MNDTEIIGIGLLLFGTVIFLFGILMLLDRALLVMSNILFLSGILVLMKPKGFFSFAIQSDKKQGTIAFFVGIILVLFKLPIPGIICELTGAYWLFGGFIPLLLSLLLKVPFLSKFFPFLSKSKDDSPL